MPQPEASAFSMTNAVWNRILMPLLRSPAGPFLGRRLAVVEYQGRRSGTHHKLVTGYRRDSGVVRIRVGAADRKTWWRNFAVPHPICLRLAGQDHEGWAHLARQDEQVSIVVDLADRPAQAR